MPSAPRSDGDELLTLREVEELLKVAPATVNRWRRGVGCGENGPFPEPDAWAGSHPRWSRSSISLWTGSTDQMHHISWIYAVPGKSAQDVIDEFRRIVAGSVGDPHRVWLRTLADGSSRIEIRWPKSREVSPQTMIASLIMGDPFPMLIRSMMVEALKARPALLQRLVLADKRLLTLAASSR